MCRHHHHQDITTAPGKKFGVLEGSRGDLHQTIAEKTDLARPPAGGGQDVVGSRASTGVGDEQDVTGSCAVEEGAEAVAGSHAIEEGAEAIAGCRAIEEGGATVAGSRVVEEGVVAVIGSRARRGSHRQRERRPSGPRRYSYLHTSPLPPLLSARPRGRERRGGAGARRGGEVVVTVWGVVAQGQDGCTVGLGAQLGLGREGVGFIYQGKSGQLIRWVGRHNYFAVSIHQFGHN
jgi:hypothetical protein